MMRGCPFLVPVFFALIVMVPPVSHAVSVSGAVVSRLCEHVKARKTIYVDRSQPEIIWSDGAMFEVAKAFPRELEELMAAPTGKPDLRLILKRMVPDPEKGWQEAKVVRSGRGQDRAVVESRDGRLTLDVASPYFGYLDARHPRARIWIKDRLSAVVFMVDGTLHGAVMPMAMPAGAPPAATK
jgi:hypothetical protein